MRLTRQYNESNKLKEQAAKETDPSIRALLLSQANRLKREHDAINKAASEAFWIEINAKYAPDIKEVNQEMIDCAIDDTVTKRTRKVKDKE